MSKDSNNKLFLLLFDSKNVFLWKMENKEKPNIAFSFRIDVISHAEAIKNAIIMTRPQVFVTLTILPTFSLGLRPKSLFH